MSTIHNFKLILAPCENYQVSYECPDLAGEGGPYPLDKTSVQQAIARGRWLNVEEGNDETYRDTCTIEQAAGIGKMLFNTFFRADIAPAWRQALDRTRRDGHQLRLLIQCPQDNKLHTIPWELLYDNDTFLALSPDVLLARYIRQSRPTRNVRVDGPIQILHSSACPRNEDPLDLASEHEIVQTTLQRQPGLPSLSALRQASGRTIGEMLGRTRDPIHVWHHSGHGELLQDPTRFVLVFDKDGQPEEVAAEDLLEVVESSQDLKLVILNVCYGGSAEGLAPLLAALNVPAVIGFRTIVLDRVALRFARELYTHLLNQPIDLAVREARRGMQGSDRPLDWARLLLFLRTSDSSLSATASVARSASPQQIAPVQAIAPAPPPPLAKPVQPSFLKSGSRINVKITGSKVGNVLTSAIVNAGRDAAPPRPEQQRDIDVTIDNSSTGSVNTFEELTIPAEEVAVFLRMLDSLPDLPVRE